MQDDILTCLVRVKSPAQLSSGYHTDPIQQPDHCYSHQLAGSHYMDRTAVHEPCVDFSVLTVKVEVELIQ
jgi:hypothetical protein